MKKILAKLCMASLTLGITLAAFAQGAAKPAQPVAAPATGEITMGLISTTSVEDTQKRWQPLLDDLAAATGLKVKSICSNEYNDVLKALNDGQAQIAWLGNKVALQAVEAEHSRIFAQLVKADGSTGYSAVVIVRTESPIKSINEITKNKGAYNFGIGNAGSTSGFLVPTVFLFERNNIDPKTHFKKLVEQSHKANISAVLKKEVDAAVNNTEELDRMKKEEPDNLKQLRVIWKSLLIPNDPLLIRNDVSPAMQKKIEAFFLSYGTGKGKVAEKQLVTLKSILDLSGFRKSNNGHLKPILYLEQYSQHNKLRTDEKMSAPEKQKKIDDLNAKFKKLEKIVGTG